MKIFLQDWLLWEHVYFAEKQFMQGVVVTYSIHTITTLQRRAGETSETTNNFANRWMNQLIGAADLYWFPNQTEKCTYVPMSGCSKAEPGTNQDSTQIPNSQWCSTQTSKCEIPNTNEFNFLSLQLETWWKIIVIHNLCMPFW